MAPSADDISGRLAAVEATLAIFIQEFREHRTVTEAYRTNLALVIASLTASIQGMTLEVKDVIEDIDKLTPIVAKYSSDRSEAIGAIKFGRGLKAASMYIAAIVSAAAGYILAMINHK